MQNYTQVVKEMLEPNDSYQSVIDTFDTLGKMLETYDKLKNNKIISKEEVQHIMLHGMFSINFYPFWQAHGAVLRPILINALQCSDDESSVIVFFQDAIPTAMTFLVPHKQLEYSEIKQKVKQRFLN